MLLVTRKAKESIVIDDDVIITVCEIRRGTVKLSVDYPKSCRVLRKEIFDKIREENKAAAASSGRLTQLLQEGYLKEEGERNPSLDSGSGTSLRNNKR